MQPSPRTRSTTFVASVSRLVAGFGLVGGAVTYRCVATAHGGVVASFGSHLPALTRIDFFTGPLAVLGVVLLASVPGLGLVRRAIGFVALVVAIGWPAIKLDEMGEVLFTISSRHGVHSHDLAVFPILVAALLLLAPWRSPLRLPSLRPSVGSISVDPGAHLRPVPQH